MRNNGMNTEFASSFIQTLLLVSDLHRIMRSTFSHIKNARGLYRQSGISPCPEDMLKIY